MVLMVNQINQTAGSAGRKMVTCYTCHRRNEPAGGDSGACWINIASRRRSQPVEVIPPAPCSRQEDLRRSDSWTKYLQGDRRGGAGSRAHQLRCRGDLRGVRHALGKVSESTSSPTRQTSVTTVVHTRTATA
jgi:hypothetical protein